MHVEKWEMSCAEKMQRCKETGCTSLHFSHTCFQRGAALWGPTNISPGLSFCTFCSNNSAIASHQVMHTCMQHLPFTHSLPGIVEFPEQRHQEKSCISLKEHVEFGCFPEGLCGSQHPTVLLPLAPCSRWHSVYLL